MEKSIASLPVFFYLLLGLSFDSGSLLKLANGQGLNCSQIPPEGACFDPDNLINHASYAMNSYYQAYGRQSHQSYFTNSALITVSDLSFGNCQYA